MHGFSAREALQSMFRFAAAKIFRATLDKERRVFLDWKLPTISSDSGLYAIKVSMY